MVNPHDLMVGVHQHIDIDILVVGFKDFIISIIYGMSSFPLTFIFFKVVKTTKQYR
jgi:hypothetical protein